MFIRVKKVKGHDYYYLVENVWKDGKCHQVVRHYIGKNKPSAQLLAAAINNPSA